MHSQMPYQSTNENLGPIISRISAADSPRNYDAVSDQDYLRLPGTHQNSMIPQDQPQRRGTQYDPPRKSQKNNNRHYDSGVRNTLQPAGYRTADNRGSSNPGGFRSQFLSQTQRRDKAGRTKSYESSLAAEEDRRNSIGPLSRRSPDAISQPPLADTYNFAP